jgi:hypothetical protein
MAIRKIPMQSQSPLNTSFEKFVYSTLQKWHVPGVAIGVVDGEHTWAEVSPMLYPQFVNIDTNM